MLWERCRNWGILTKCRSRFIVTFNEFLGRMHSSDSYATRRQHWTISTVRKNSSCGIKSSKSWLSTDFTLGTICNRWSDHNLAIYRPRCSGKDVRAARKAQAQPKQILWLDFRRLLKWLSWAQKWVGHALWIRQEANRLCNPLHQGLFSEQRPLLKIQEWLCSHHTAWWALIKQSKDEQSSEGWKS